MLTTPAAQLLTRFHMFGEMNMWGKNRTALTELIRKGYVARKGAKGHTFILV